MSSHVRLFLQSMHFNEMFWSGSVMLCHAFYISTLKVNVDLKYLSWEEGGRGAGGLRFLTYSKNILKLIIDLVRV